MDIQLQLYSILREKLPPELKGRTLVHLNDGATLKDLLRELDINRKVAISINGVLETDHSRVLHDGEEVKVFTSIGGG